jgi:hypothetical protein
VRVDCWPAEAKHFPTNGRRIAPFIFCINQERFAFTCVTLLVIMLGDDTEYHLSPEM